MRSRALVLATLVIGLFACATSAHALVFEKIEFQRSRDGKAGSGRFVEFTNNADHTRENLTFRSIPDQSDFPTEMRRLLRDIKLKNPTAKLQILERKTGEDVVITYIGDGSGDRASVNVWRLARNGGQGLFAIIYQMDFSLDALSKSTEARITSHSAAVEVTRFDLGTASKLLLPDRR